MDLISIPASQRNYRIVPAEGLQKASLFTDIPQYLVSASGVRSVGTVVGVSWDACAWLTDPVAS